MALEQMTQGKPTIDIGIDDEARATIADGLSTVLADTYTLYLRTHGHHWNVTGPMFNTLHLMFEEQYREMWAAVDDVAERIRALGHPAPAGYSGFAKRTSIGDEREGLNAMEMVADLVQGHETVVRTIRGVLQVADEHDDDTTVDLLTQRLSTHEKTAWMLRSLLE